MRAKTKTIVFRVEEPLYKFIKDFAKSQGLKVSEMMRNILIYFHISYFLGQVTPTNMSLKEFFSLVLPEIEREFIAKYGTKKQMERFLKKKMIKM